MKKTFHYFLTLAAALNAGFASAQNPQEQPSRPPAPEGPRREGPRREGQPSRDERPAQRPFDSGRRDEARQPEGRDFPGGRSGDSMLRDRLRNAPPRPQTPQPYIGVITRPLDPALNAQIGLTPGLGLIVEDIVPDGPAAAAGVQPMDVIKQLNDQLVSTPGHLATLVRHFGKDSEVTLLVVRQGREQKIPLKIGERLMPEPAPFGDGGFGGMRMPAVMSEAFERRFGVMGRGGEGPARGPGNAQNRPAEPQPAAPEGQSFQNQISTTWNTATARVSLKDGNGEIEVRSDNGKRTLTAKNPKGETVFDGPIDTEEQRKFVPAEFRKMLEQVEVQSRADRPPGRVGAGARASAGTLAPAPEPDRPQPRRGEPEVQ